MVAGSASGHRCRNYESPIRRAPINPSTNSALFPLSYFPRAFSGSIIWNVNRPCRACARKIKRKEGLGPCFSPPRCRLTLSHAPLHFLAVVSFGGTAASQTKLRLSPRAQPLRPASFCEQLEEPCPCKDRPPNFNRTCAARTREDTRTYYVRRQHAGCTTNSFTTLYFLFF